MLLYTRDGVVVATHRDDQNVDPSIYGAGVRVVPVPQGMVLVKSGEAPSDIVLDARPCLEPEATTDLLIAYAADLRWRAASAGITVGGVSLKTDDTSQTKVGQVKQAFDTGTITTVTFKDDGGVFRTLNASAFNALYSAVVLHIQACFDAEGDAVAAIRATPPTVTSFDEVDAIFALIG